MRTKVERGFYNTWWGQKFIGHFAYGICQQCRRILRPIEADEKYFYFDHDHNIDVVVIYPDSRPRYRYRYLPSRHTMINTKIEEAVEQWIFSGENFYKLENRLQELFNSL